MSHDDPDEKMFHDRAAAMALLEGGQCIDGEDDVDDISIAGASEAAPGDSLDRKTSLRANKWNELNRVARFSRINPPTVLQGIIGNQAEVGPGQNAQVANWGGEDAETLPVTVTFAPVDPFVTPAPAGVAELRPFGIVQFGTHGALVRAEVDIGRGCQFTVGASEVTLQVGLELLFGTGTMKLAGMLSFFPVSHVVPITRTLHGTLAASSLTFARPNFAQNVSIWRSTPGGAVTLNFLGATGLSLYDVTLAAGAFMFTPVPLSDAVFFVSASSAGIMGIELIFGLAF